MKLLELRQLSVSYGGIQAVKGIDLTVQQGELVCLIGANGAGKSTTLRAISGLVPVSGGSIAYEESDVGALASFQRARRGLVMVPEGRGIFGRLTIAENLALGAYRRDDKAAVSRDIDRVLALFPRLAERRRQAAGTLSGGEQQMLAMGRAMLATPRLLLLDEPSMGLSPIMVQTVFDSIRKVASEGVTILLVEQNAKLALETSQRGYVMESGEITLSGESRTLLVDPKVRAAYLGEASPANAPE